MRSSFLFFLFLLPCILFAQNSTVDFTKDWVVAQNEQEIYYHCDCVLKYGEVFDGPFVCYNLEGAKIKAYNFKDNVLHGMVYEYFPSGQLKVSAEYNMGIPIGEWKEWDEEGELVVHKTFDESNNNIADYFQEDKKYNPNPKPVKPSEPVIYGTECLLLKVDKQKYACSDENLEKWYSVPPLPPDYIESGIYEGDTLIVMVKYLVTSKGKVAETELIQSCGDDFLDELAVIHVENMLPFEAAKRYGEPVGTVMIAEILFGF